MNAGKANEEGERLTLLVGATGFHPHVLGVRLGVETVRELQLHCDALFQRPPPPKKRSHANEGGLVGRKDRRKSRIADKKQKKETEQREPRLTPSLVSTLNQLGTHTGLFSASSASSKSTLPSFLTREA